MADVAALVSASKELLTLVSLVIRRAAMFKPTLTRLQTTLVSISPLIKDLSQLNDELGRSPEEILLLSRKMEEGKALVFKCSNINCWNCLAIPYYSMQLNDLEKEIFRFFWVNIQAQMARDQKETLLEVRKIPDKIVELLVQEKLADTSTAAAQLPLLDSKLSHPEMIIRKEEIEIAGLSMGPLQPDLHGSESDISHSEMKEEIEAAGSSMPLPQPDLCEPKLDISHLKIVMLKVELYNDKIEAEAIKAVSGLSGVESVSVNMNDKKLTLIGDIDPVYVARELRKLCHTEIESVGPAKPKKPDEKKKNPNDKTDLVNAYEAYYARMGPPYYYLRPVELEEYRASAMCVIC